MEKYRKFITFYAGSSSYANNSYIQTALIDDSVEDIPNDLFYNCKNLRNVIISNKVKSIDLSAFDECSSLQEIRIAHSNEMIWNNTNWFKELKDWCDTKLIKLIC